MLKFKSLPLFAALATVALLAGAGSSMAAAEITSVNFGPPGPGTSVAASNAHQARFAANNTQTFLSNGVTFTATVFPGDPCGTAVRADPEDFTTATVLTKAASAKTPRVPPGTDVPNSSGPVDCDPCEIAGSITRSMFDAGSAVIRRCHRSGRYKLPKQFQVWTASTVSGCSVSSPRPCSGARIFAGTDGLRKCEGDLSVNFPRCWVQAVAAARQYTSPAGDASDRLCPYQLPQSAMASWSFWPLAACCLAASCWNIAKGVPRSEPPDTKSSFSTRRIF